jgi:hypothetical protein
MTLLEIFISYVSINDNMIYFMTTLELFIIISNTCQVILSKLFAGYGHLTKYKLPIKERSVSPTPTKK